VSTSEYPAQRVSRVRLTKLRGAVAAREVGAEVWIMGGLVVVAAVIRIIVINNQSFWWDEALTAYEVRLPFGAMINTVLHVETTPPLYFVLVWIWAHLFGASEVALRSVSTLAGIVLVPIAYLCARELVSRWAGVVAAAFVALNPFMIWYSQEARAYMLLAALTGASFLWFIRARRDPSPRSLAWWAIWSSLAVMTHFFAGFAVAPEALWLLWIVRTRLVAAAVVVVAFVQGAMLPIALVDTSHGTWWIARIPRIHRIASTILEWGVSIVYRRATITEALVGGAIFLLVVTLLLVLGGDKQTRAGAKVGAAIAACVMLVPLALGFLGQDYFFSRNLIPAFVPLTTVVAAACVVPRARVLGGAFAIALLSMFSVAAVTVQTEPTLERPNWRAVAHAIGPTAVPRAILYAGGNYADPLKIYLPHVNWDEPPAQPVRIQEIDLVGALKWLPPIRRRAPEGTRLLGYKITTGSAIDRFALRDPITTSINGLVELAPHLLRHMPGSLLVFFQQPGP
jgi:mannosyltransferase